MQRSIRFPCAFAGVLLALGGPAAVAGPVNINSADAATLARELKGVGLKRAQAIVDYRSKHGPFKSADELALVKGLGRGAIDKNRADIRTDAAKAGATKPVTPVTSATPSGRKP